MSKQIQDILTVARRYIGIKESPPNSNNVVFNTRYYGRAVSGPAYPWCCAFVWCLFQDIGAPELFYGGNRTASCTTLMNFAKSSGLFHTKDFRPGDLALYNWEGKKNVAVHVGIITEVKSGSIVAIEGNTAFGNDSDGGAVMERERRLNTLVGVYRPNYEEGAEVTQAEFNKMLDTALTERAGRVVSDWARVSWEKAVKRGVFDGTAPQGYITREQVAAVLDRVGVLK